MAFLSDLADQISSQLSIGENDNRTLDLGDFLEKTDRSAERRYVEEGYLRRDPYNTDVKQFEALMQEPNATLLIKKRMFSSTAENFRSDFMDADEKIYFKSIKILFQNKCRQIATLEKLSKIQKITSVVGDINEQLTPIIITLADTLSNGLDSGSDLFGAANVNNSIYDDINKFTGVVDQLRRTYTFSTTNNYTSWITDDSNLFQTQFGQGTGVIEITNFTGLTTTVTNNISNQGTFSCSISDPYESMVITEYDIEKAISDATNSAYNHKSFQFGKEAVEQIINDAQVKLNKLRNARGASPISFKVNPDTLLGKRVTAIIDREGVELPFDYKALDFNSFNLNSGTSSVTVAPEYLADQVPGSSVFLVIGFNGLSTGRENFGALDLGKLGTIPGHTGIDSELSVFQRLVSAIFNKIQLDANSKNALQTNNINTNYARRKLRQNFSGKLIIQPMDVVHIYMTSKSRYDTKLLSGLNNMFTGAGILQNLNKTLLDFKNTVGGLFAPAGNISFQAEKAAYGCGGLPNFLWSLIRTQFVTEKEGTHTFAGIVNYANDHWSDGKFTITVSGSDNSAYFEQGQVNFKPGADAFNGAFFDPLTPFKNNFDTITINSNNKNNSLELLNENKFLLSPTGKNVKFKLGPNAGQSATDANLIHDRVVYSTNDKPTSIFYAPDGLVYRWKEGIGVFTQFGSSLEVNNPNMIGSPNIATEPFAGQDVMNVLSLLISGQPYNFASYWKATHSLNQIGVDPQNQQSPAYAYATSLQQNLIKNNALWGNFIPFKNLVIDEKTYSQALQKQTTIIQKNQDLGAQINQLKILNNQSIISGANSIFSDISATSKSGFVSAKSEGNILVQQINKNIADLSTEDKDYLVTVGDDTSFDSDAFIDTSKIGMKTSDSSIRKTIRKQINYLTRRMSYDVRGNTDKNLLIIDDSYDKDYDLLAYETTLGNMSLFSSDFMNVKEKIKTTAEILNLEVFCDTQGHVRIRPPQYNRMPSSIFYRMMYLKQTSGIQIFPQFLDDFFNNQIDTMRERVEILEDLIRLDCAVLGYNNDYTAKSFILSTGDSAGSSNATSGTGSSFEFLSTEDGIIVDINNLLKVANSDKVDDSINESLKSFTNILKGQAISTKDIFSNSQRYFIIANAINTEKLSQAGYSIRDINSFVGNTKVDDLITRIQIKSGQKISRMDFIDTNDEGFKDIKGAETIDIFKITKDLADKIKERQKVVKLFYNVVKNSSEFRDLDNKNNTGNKLLTQGSFGNDNVPEMYAHMLEDETYDDYGPGSGTRYIIKRAQIKSIDIAEQAPDHTMIEVQGVLSPFHVDPVAGFNGTFPLQGNGQVTAIAVDYDSWRNYGFKSGAAIKVPFLNNPDTQCAPYASMILSRNRKNILQGSITITGNEFMQPGEVVFLEDRGLLFYVTSVSHNFQFGSAFTTTLKLQYGHTPGEYIPTVLDAIGKMIYNNRDTGTLLNQRQSDSGNQTNLGVLLRKTKENSKSNQSDPTAHFNAQVIDNILYQSARIIGANNSKGINMIANVELRIYHNSSPNGDLINFANNIRNILIGESNDLFPDGSLDDRRAPTLPKNSVKEISLTTIDLTDGNDRRSPSQKAWDMARNQASSISDRNSNISVSSSNTEELDAAKKLVDKSKIALFNYVVDCWISFTRLDPKNAK